MRLLKPVAAGVLALGVLLSGAYAVAQSAAEAAVAEAIARLREALGPNAQIEHGTIRAEPIAGRVRITSLSFTPDSSNPEAFLVSDVVVDGLRPGGTGFTRLSLHATRILVWGQERGRIGSITIEGLTIPPQPGFSLADVTLDSLDVLDVAWTLPDDSALHVGYLGVTGIGGDRPDRFEIADLVMIGTRDLGFERVQIEFLDLEGARLLPIVLATIEGRPPTTPRGPSQGTIRGLLVRADGLDIVRLGEATSSSDDEDRQPGTQRSTTTVTDLVIGLPPEAREALNGLETIRLDITSETLINQDRGDYEVESFRVEAEGLGVIELTGRVTGATLPPAGDPLTTGLLHGFTVSFQDAGLVARALAGAARLSGVTEAEMRAQVQQALAEIEAMLGVLPQAGAGPERKGGAEPPPPESKLGPQAAPASPGGRSLREFLDRPGRIIITAQPPQPVAFAEMGGAMMGLGPVDLMARLGLRIEYR